MLPEFVKKGENEVRDQTTKYLVAAFGLVAGLAWNDAVKSLIELLFPFAQSSVWAKFAYAILITLLVIFVGKYIFKSSHAQ